MLSHFGLVQLFLTLRTVAHQAPLSTGFSSPHSLSQMVAQVEGMLQGRYKGRDHGEEIVLSGLWAAFIPAPGSHSLHQDHRW